jgi:hypothetical protein
MGTRHLLNSIKVHVPTKLVFAEDSARENEPLHGHDCATFFSSPFLFQFFETSIGGFKCKAA